LEALLLPFVRWRIKECQEGNEGKRVQGGIKFLLLFSIGGREAV
jgi:hypothetical protein